MDVKRSKANLYEQAVATDTKTTDLSADVKATRVKSTNAGINGQIAVTNSKAGNANAIASDFAATKVPTSPVKSAQGEFQLTASFHQAKLSNEIDQKLNPHSVVQRNQTFTERVVNDAAKGILKAARLNSSASNESAIHNSVAAAQLAVSAIVSAVPSAGPIIGALFTAISAMIQADESQDKATAVVDQLATPGWTALKKDHDDSE